MILVAHKQLMHARLTNTGGYTFDLTIVYGKRTVVKRRELWNELNSFRSVSNGKDWLIFGNFNEIRHPSERVGSGGFDRTGLEPLSSKTQLMGSLNSKQLGMNLPGRIERGHNTQSPD